MSPPDQDPLLPLEEIAHRLEAILAQSPADETEFVWLESLQGQARRQRSRIDVTGGPQRTIMVRVLDHGRVGSYRTGAGDVGDLADAVRQAMAQARVREPLSGLPHLPADATPLKGPDDLYDQEIGELTEKRVRSLLERPKIRQENLLFSWAEGRVAVFNSRDVRRMARVTAAACEVRTGRRPGSGRAANASRHLAKVDLAALMERAGSRQGGGEVAEPPEGPVPAVLGPEAVIELCDLLNQTSFSAKAYYDGTSFLREHINIQVFDREFHLCDDGTDPSGIPFPFDLEGTAKRRVELIAKGAPKTPTLDQRQAAVLGLPPTAHAIGGDNARAENLILVGGELSEEELIREVGEGLWIGWLDHLECLEPKRVLIRCRARGVRKIVDGRLGPSLPDFFWVDSLLRAFSGLAGIGRTPARRLSRDGYLGAVTAPALALASMERVAESG